MSSCRQHVLDSDDDTAALTVGVLGEFQGRRMGEPWAPPASHRAASLGSLLATKPGRLIEKHVLLDALWPERPPPSAANALQVYASQLRRILGKEVVYGNRLGYRLDLPPEAIDAHVFEERVLDGGRAFRRLHLARAASHFRSALALWRGRPYQDMTPQAAASRAARMLEFRAIALDGLLACEIEMAAIGEGDSLSACVARARERVLEEPFREATQFNLIRALAAAGRFSEASLAFQEAQNLLRDEMGTFAGPRLIHLHDAVLRRDQSLSPIVRHVPLDVRDVDAALLPTVRDIASATVDLHATLTTSPGLSINDRAALVPTLTWALIADFPLGVFSIATPDLAEWEPPKLPDSSVILCDPEDLGAAIPQAAPTIPRALAIVEIDDVEPSTIRHLKRIIATGHTSVVVLSDDQLGLGDEYVVHARPAPRELKVS